MDGADTHLPILGEARGWVTMAAQRKGDAEEDEAEAEEEDEADARIFKRIITPVIPCSPFSHRFLCHYFAPSPPPIISSAMDLRPCCLFTCIKLHDPLSLLPSHLVPCISGPSILFSPSDSNESIAMSRRSEQLWEVELIVQPSEQIEFKFLLKDLKNPSVRILEESPNHLLRKPDGNECFSSSAAFQIPGTERLIDLPTEFLVESMPLSSLIALWRNYNKEKHAMSATTSIAESSIPGAYKTYASERQHLQQSDDALKMLPRQRSVSIQDLVVLGSEAELPLGIPVVDNVDQSSNMKTVHSNISPHNMQRVTNNLSMINNTARKNMLEILPPPTYIVTDQKLVPKERRRLAIIMVGLPARGKTFTAAKLTRYLRWLGHATKHFNVGQYRRHLLGHNQTADFFRGDNPEGLDARNEVASLAMEDMLEWMQKGGQIGIFDATNSTKKRRKMLLNICEGKCKVIFLEVICNDRTVIDRNILLKIQQSPDYVDMSDREEALKDFKSRLANYEKVYEPVAEGSYIKMIDTVGGDGGQVQINNVGGYLPGRILFFLVNTHTNPRPIFLTRPGESFGTIHGRVGGDQKLSDNGKKYAKALADFINEKLKGEETASVWTSMLQRTADTAVHLTEFPKVQWRALDDINVGICDAMTYDDIKNKMPEEYEARRIDKLRYRYPRGESYLDVIQRLEPVIIELERQHSAVVIVTHQAVIRSLYGYFADKPIEQIPYLEIPLHTVIEIQMGVGGVEEKRYKLL